MVEWTLQLSAKDNKNQELVNNYAKETERGEAALANALVAKYPGL